MLTRLSKTSWFGNTLAAVAFAAFIIGMSFTVLGETKESRDWGQVALYLSGGLAIGILIVCAVEYRHSRSQEGEK